MTRLRTALMLLALALLANCSELHYRPFTYTTVGDMRPGPGLFTGADGEFVVYRKEKETGDARGAPAAHPDAK